MTQAAPPPESLPILHVDDALVVVDKPSGLAVHRGWANDRVVAMTLARDAVGAWVYPVHRLDRGTSGVLLFARSPEHARTLGDQFMERTTTKRYLALLRGIPKPHEGVIERPLSKEKGAPHQDAATRYRLLATFEDRYSWVEAQPLTGRRHQLRRHFAAISCHLIGDVKYGKGLHNRRFRADFGLHRLALHAGALTITHPLTGEPTTYRAPLPQDLREPFTQMNAPGSVLDFPEAP